MSQPAGCHAASQLRWSLPFQLLPQLPTDRGKHDPIAGLPRKIAGCCASHW